MDSLGYALRTQTLQEKKREPTEGGGMDLENLDNAS
jgi:hypothetical protein